MKKRKRGQDWPAKVDPVQESQLRRNELEKKLVHCEKLLKRALKTARGFERQKLGKRIRLAADKDDAAETGRLQMELGVLKTLDLSITADAYLHKTLLKSKSISESELFPKAARADIKKTDGSSEQSLATSSVAARIYNTKPVKETMTQIVNSLHARLGIPNPTEARKKKVSTNRDSEPNDLGEPGPEDHFMDEDEEEDEDGQGDLLEGPEIGGDEGGVTPAQEGLIFSSESAPLGNMSPYNDQLGSSSSEQSNAEDDGEDGIQRPSANRSHSPPPSDPSVSFSQRSQSPQPPPTAKKSTKLPQQSDSKPGSTFLPTLMGGYWSGSESVTDDEGVALAPRKNRPGQQARRALWEKKFGPRANHLKGHGLGKGGDKGWDPRRGAQGMDEKRARRGSGRARGGGSGFMRSKGKATGENSIAVKRRARGMGERDDAGPLHPSWEAAKKAKEAKKTATFQGKKVVFE